MSLAIQGIPFNDLILGTRDLIRITEQMDRIKCRVFGILHRFAGRLERGWGVLSAGHFTEFSHRGDHTARNREGHKAEEPHQGSHRVNRDT